MNINIEELRRLFSRSEDINVQLKDNFNNIVTELNNVCENVKSSGLTEINKEFTEYVNEIATELTTNMEVVIAFLENQISSYSGTNETSEAQFNELNNQLNNINI
ncbi:MAG: hypothetical protein ACLUFU_06285 [Bacilli bacterium]